MQLFATKINDIQAQIEALQVEAAKLQDLENATASSLANLKAVVANIKEDEAAIATLKSAIMDLFPGEEDRYICGDCGNSFPDKEMVEGEDFCVNCGESKYDSQAVEDEDEENPSPGNKQEPKFGTPDKPCPATTTGECLNPECEGETFVCEGCGKETLYCFGGDGDELCNNCWTPPEDETTDEMREKIQRFKELRERQSQAEEEKAAPRFKKMFDSEPDPDPDDCDLVIYSDQAHRYKNTLGVHFKLKRDAKKWLEIFELKYPECRVEVNNDEYEKFKYLLTVIKPDGNDPKWWETVSKFNYSQPPTVSGQANAPIEPQKPAVHQTLPHIVLDEEAADSDFVFIATGQGWQKVIHNGEVLGVIYSNPSGWELENGDQFETREEAATALFNSTPSAA